MNIDKVAQQEARFRRPYRVFPNARSAFSAFLKALSWQADELILLPAYVGWSAREGSGVFDPIQTPHLPHAFYRVDERLRVDLDHLEHLFSTNRVKVLVLIHYFGCVDPSYGEMVALARQYGTIVLEDEAHAMLTDLVGGKSGRLGDACIFSLHKLLPVKTGGMLVFNPNMECLLEKTDSQQGTVALPWTYDLKQIACRRRDNLDRLHQLLQPTAAEIDPLWGLPGPGEVPQTLPVIIRNVSRDQLYSAMNDAGFGVVSLYHTLINEITADEFPASHFLARHILNLPVHQDATPQALEAMVVQLQRCLDHLS